MKMQDRLDEIEPERLAEIRASNDQIIADGTAIYNRCVEVIGEFENAPDLDKVSFLSGYFWGISKSRHDLKKALEN
jgi:hypothetical protein